MRSGPSQSFLSRVYMFLRGDAWLRYFTLRVHKFTFQWDLFLHLSVFLFSLLPFAFTSERIYAVLPISVWGIYNILFLIGARLTIFFIHVSPLNISNQTCKSSVSGVWPLSIDVSSQHRGIFFAKVELQCYSHALTLFSEFCPYSLSPSYVLCCR